MGNRALLDDILNDWVGDLGGFEYKLTHAVGKGIITQGQRDTIVVALEAGHAASHRGFTPTTQQLWLVLDIVEHALNDRYIIPDTSRILAGDIPQRQKGAMTDGT